MRRRPAAPEPFVKGLGVQALAELASVVAIASRATDRLAAAHDASHYLLTPQAVATPGNAGEVAAVFEVATRQNLPVTLRSGGTSLSGQAGSQSLLVDTRRHFRQIEVLDDGARVRTGPGATVRAVNIRLARHARKLGPDPASEIACTIGGVVANNSSGMACGITQNTYRTLESAILVLPSGTVIDTAGPNADAILRDREPDIHAGLLRLRARVRNDTESVATIRRLHSIKNTMGYGLNSFLDFEDPVEILEHLVIGSEGTLAFVAEATFRTVPLKTQLATALLYFDDLESAVGAVPALVDAGFATVELLDATSLRVAQGDPEAPPSLLALQVVEHAALLVELQEESPAALEAGRARAADVLSRLPLVSPAVLSTDSGLRAQLWHIRKGLYTLVAGARPAGTTALLEDIAVPVAMLAQTCSSLRALMIVHGYDDSVIFGHAKDGNIHFMLNERFDDPSSLERYERFTREMVELVLANGGTLKAEHGTGRIMAPFVRAQYGDELYIVMQELKSVIDPSGILNPGVLLSDDPQAHLRNLKTAPTVEEEVDRCVECGYCEPGCPSKDVTLTPRERIVLRRELQRARDAGDTALVAELEREYRYDGVETCAVDGMCQVACPVMINTGDLVRRLRAEEQSRPVQAAWKTAARHWDGLSRVGGIALTMTDKLPPAIPVLATDVGRALLGKEAVPRYSRELPPGGRRRRTRDDDKPTAVYFASCTTTMFGPAVDGGGVSESFLALCERAGVRLRTPDDLPSLCCGTPWKSKGLSDGYAEMKERVVESLRLATRGGRLPVVSDASSCTEGLEVLLEAAGDLGIRVVDAVEFVAQSVLPKLTVSQRLENLVLHPTCSSQRLGIDEPFVLVGRAIADRVEIPDDWGCCAFAGDRGMLHPELTASATRAEAREVELLGPAAHASLNRTCELGMTRATGERYEHILELLERATRPQPV